MARMSGQWNQVGEYLVHGNHYILVLVFTNK